MSKDKEEFKALIGRKLASIEESLVLLSTTINELKHHAMNNNKELLEQLSEQIKKIDYLNIEQVKSNEKPKTLRAKKTTESKSAKTMDYSKMAINAFIVHMYCQEEKEFREVVSDEVIEQAFKSPGGKKVIETLKGTGDDEASKKKKAKAIYDYLKEKDQITLTRLRDLKKSMASRSETQSVASGHDNDPDIDGSQLATDDPNDIEEY